MGFFVCFTVRNPRPMDYSKLLSSQLSAVSAINKQAELLSSRVNLIPQNILGASIVTSLEKFTRSFDSLNLAAKLTETSHPKFDFSALSSIQSSNLAIANLMKPDSMSLAIGGMNKSPWVNEISKASLNIMNSHDSIKELLGSRPFQIELGISKMNELKINGSLVDSFTIQTALTKASAYTFQAEKSLLKVNSETVGNLIGLNSSQKTSIASSFSDLSISYNSVFSQFQANPALIPQVNPFLFKSVPASFLNSANLLGTLSVEIEDDIEEEELLEEIYSESSILSLLGEINPDLKSLWHGANAAINSNQPDSIRHFATSTRELFTHVLHTLAPDKQIEAWDKRPDFYHEGKPTRRARLLYICREVNYDSMKDFVNKDVTSILSVVDLFNSETHKIKSDLTPKQIVALKVKAETTLKYIMEVGLK